MFSADSVFCYYYVRTAVQHQVRRACHKLTGQTIAIKTYERAKITDPQQWKRIQQEVKLMERLNHPRYVVHQ
jgi:serine/threonine protein kinase